MKIHRADIRDEGIYFRQDKTDARLLVRWSPELRAVVDTAHDLANAISPLAFGPNKGKDPAALAAKGSAHAGHVLVGLFRHRDHHRSQRHVFVGLAQRGLDRV